MKIETIDITAFEYHDKINGNMYFNADIYINYNSDNQIKIHLPMQYGSNNQFLFASLNRLNELKYINTNRPLWEYCRENNITLRTNTKTGYKERELRKLDKEAIPLQYS